MLAAVSDAIDVVLRDGATARLRQASIDDREPLREFYEHLSSQSRYFRFFGKPRVGTIVDDVVRALASRDAVTLVAECRWPRHSRRRRVRGEWTRVAAAWHCDVR